MSKDFYIKTLEDLSKEIDYTPRLTIKSRDLIKKTAPPKDVSSNWPAPLQAFYSVMNGASINWMHRKFKEPHVCGKINLLPADKVAADGKDLIWFESSPANDPLKNFRLVDFFVDEAAVGFYDDGNAKGEMHLYLFEAEPIPLGVDFEGYIRLLREARGYFYWQQVLIAFKTGKENQESEDFKTYMPQIFTDFKFDEFIKMYKSLRID